MSTPTAAELRAAWESMRIRYAFRHWPSDYDAVMADPVACRLVRLEATGRRRRRPGADPPLNTGRTSCWPPARTAPPPGVDFKSRAAGEHGDE